MTSETPEALASLEANETSEPTKQEQSGPLYTEDASLDAAAQVLFENHQRCINAAIWRTLGPNADLSGDLAKDVQDAQNRTLWWIRRNIQELLRPGTARSSTRLYAGAKLQARGVNKANLRNRSRFVLMNTTDETAVTKAKRDATRTEWDKTLEETAHKANPAKMLRMMCRDCGGNVSNVLSQSNGSVSSSLYTLDCGHVRAA